MYIKFQEKGLFYPKKTRKNFLEKKTGKGQGS